MSAARSLTWICPRAPIYVDKTLRQRHAYFSAFTARLINAHHHVRGSRQTLGSMRCRHFLHNHERAHIGSGDARLLGRLLVFGIGLALVVWIGLQRKLERHRWGNGALNAKLDLKYLRTRTTNFTISTSRKPPKSQQLLVTRRRYAFQTGDALVHVEGGLIARHRRSSRTQRGRTQRRDS